MAEMRPTNNSGSVPVPDPTILTTQALLREIESLSERMAHDDNNMLQLIQSKLDGVIIRIDGNDTAVRLLRDGNDKVPLAITSAVENLKMLHDEKFLSVETKFEERDKRADQTSRDSKVAVDAALKAQQEAFSEQNKSSALAISKSEASTTKQIDQIGSNIALLAKAIDDKVADIKDRLTKIESIALGVMAQKTETSQVSQVQGVGQNLIGMIVMGLIAAGALAVAILKP